MSGECNHTTTRADWLTALAIAVYGVVLIWQADTRIIAGLDADRYAFMESLVERGVCHVDEASMVSIDRIRVGDHFYPAKPPLLSFAGAGVYAIVYHGLGWRFATYPAAVVRLMIAVFVVVPVCILLWMFWRALRVRLTAACIGNRAAITRAAGLTVLLAAGSILLPYSIAFTNHPLAGTLLFGAFLFLANPAEPVRCSRWFLAGLLAGLSAAVDLIPGTVFYAVAIIWALRAGKRPLAALVGAGAIVALVHLSLNALTLGTLVPGYLIADGQFYPGSPWLVEDSPTSEFPNYRAALYHYLIGHRSVLILEPLLFAGAVGAALAWRAQGREKRATAVASLVVFAALLVLVPWFSLRGLGGTVYGPRHLVPVAALLYFHLPYVFRLARRPHARVLAGFLVAWSLLINGIGVLDPWCRRDLSVYEPLDVLAGRLAVATDWQFPERIVEYTAPNASHGFTVLGMKRRQAGQSEKAIASFERALKTEPFRGEALYGLGVVARETGRDALAISVFERLLAQEPGNAWAWGHLGCEKLSLGQVDEARKALDKALRLDPKNPVARELADQLARTR